MNNARYEELKREFKEFTLRLEEDIVKNSEQVDKQQIANRIIKHFEDISDEFNEVVKDEN